MAFSLFIDVSQALPQKSLRSPIIWLTLERVNHTFWPPRFPRLISDKPQSIISKFVGRILITLYRTFQAANYVSSVYKHHYLSWQQTSSIVYLTVTIFNLFTVFFYSFWFHSYRWLSVYDVVSSILCMRVRHRYANLCGYWLKLKQQLAENN